MVALAVEAADGLLIHPFCTDASVQVLLADVPEAFPVVGQTIVGLASSEESLEQARTAARGLVAFYASTPAYRRVLDVHGWGDLQGELQALTRAGRWAELPAAVPDEVLDAVALLGSPADVAAALRQRFPASSRVALSTPHPVSTSLLAELVDAVA
jgi:hypothetical protein